MAFHRPTLAELVERIQQDLVSRLALESPILRRSVAYILARVIAGAAHMLHGHIAYLSRQVFPDQSDREFLLRQGALFGLTLRPAGYASRDVEFSGLPGMLIPKGTVLIRADGAEYTTNADAKIIARRAVVTVTARIAGAKGTLEQGESLSLRSPIAGVASTATVLADNAVDGSDEESIESFRARVIERMRSPPHGGNKADYEAWAKEIPGVTRAWCYPTEDGAGTVTVRFVRDDDDSPIPDSGEVAVMQAHLEALAPVTAAVTALAPVASPLDVTVHIVPDTAATRAAVEAELRDLLRREAEPGKTVLLSRIRNAIGDAEGVADYTLTSPAADVTHATGHMAVLGVVTFV
jgi:uncharacterized phage protein gp47/JayE